MLTDTLKAALLAELRFAKRQQWAVTAAVLGLMAGAYTTLQPLGLWEKRVAVSFICIVAAGGSWLLYNLQCHLRNTRLAIDWRDTNPLWRGAEIVIGMWIALGASAAAVCYSLWRDGAVHRLPLTMQDQVY